MLRIAVLDDQELYVNKIDEITRKAMLKHGIAYELFKYTSTEEFLYDLSEDNKCDIYLIDVELQTTSGLEVARQIREKYYDSVIIYVTNYIEYAVAGYEVNAYRYIPKNILEEKLPEAYAAVYVNIENRKKNGWSQEQLAEMSDMSPVYLGEVERGRKVISVDKFINLVKALGVSADYLLCNDLPSGEPYMFDEITEKFKNLTLEQRKIAIDILDGYLKNIP